MAIKTANGDGSLENTLASKLPYSYGTATPSTTTDGFLWYDENDTPPTPKFWDGAAFQALGSGYQQISSISLSGSAVTFSGISTAYKSLRVVIAAAASSSDCRIGLSHSGSSNWRTSILAYEGTGTPTSVGTNASYIDLSGVDIDASSNGLHSVIDIPNANTSFSLRKLAFVASAFVNTGTIFCASNIVGAATTAATNITSITITATAGTFASGSAYLYGSL